MSIHLSDKKTYFIAFGLLTLMFCLAFFSVKNDSLTFDEMAHIGAGYSYLVKQDMRLNPEHPPLIKDLSALPLLSLNLNFPENDNSWLQKDYPYWWHQFDFGNQLIYKINSNPEQIILYSRMPIILLLILLATAVFFWSRKIFGNKGGLLALFFLAFSPTILAHGRLVTTDVGIALAVVLSTYFWIKLLDNPKKMNIVLAGFFFALAMLIKFSAVLLIPFFGLITLAYAILFKKNILKYIGIGLLAGLIAIILVIWPFYHLHVQNLPLEQQIRDTRVILRDSVIPDYLAKTNIWLSGNQITRGLGHFLFGILMTINRSSTGNSTYFMGKMSSQGFKRYFPIIYAIKEPLAFHLITIIALLFLAWSIIKILIPEPVEGLKFQTKKCAFDSAQAIKYRLIRAVKSHFAEISMFLFILIYWAFSINSKLNIGLRHLLPIFPFTIILATGIFSKWLKPPFLKLKTALIFGLIIWQAIGVIMVYPHFLSYFNELIGGPKNGYLYATDSNLDWGQDLKRLKEWVDGQPAEKIYIDYFGGGDLDYYLDGKYVKWDSKNSPDELPENCFLAISLNQLQGGRAEPVNGYDQPTDYYRWLDNYQPVAKIGYSIFVYYIE